MDKGWMLVTVSLTFLQMQCIIIINFITYLAEDEYGHKHTKSSKNLKLNILVPSF